MKKLLRHIFSVINKQLNPKHSGEDAYILIKDSLTSECPIMIARFGAVEIKAVLYAVLPFPLKFLLKSYVYNHIHTNAGFFPVNEEAINKFSKLMIESMKQVDILASWRLEELFFKKELNKKIKITLGDLGPTVNSGYSWSSVLKGKKVLVIHPFAKSIESQYNKNRTKLFYSPNILPEFKSLQTITAVQTIAGDTAGFNSWFDALKYMEDEVLKKDFDIALIGCGAYGFPLAAFIKSIGKKASHIGGPLQLFFGIKGKRWDNSRLYNEFWISPSNNERPTGLNKVEGGCYW